MSNPLSDTICCTTPMPDKERTLAAFHQRYPAFATVFGEEMATSAQMIWSAAWQACAAEAERDGLYLHITSNGDGACVAVSRCDEDGRIAKVLWEAPVDLPEPAQQSIVEKLAYDMPLPCDVLLLPSTRIHKGAYVGALLNALRVRATFALKYGHPTLSGRDMPEEFHDLEATDELLVPYAMVLDAIAAVQYGPGGEQAHAVCEQVRHHLKELLETGGE